MDLQFIRDRISVLRTKKNVSEYRMSTDLGHSKSYMQSISSGRSVPSLGEFLYICEYLGVTPREFFDEDIAEPQLVQKLLPGGRGAPQRVQKDPFACCCASGFSMKRGTATGAATGVGLVISS